MPAPTRESGLPPLDGHTQLIDYAGGSNPVYIGTALSCSPFPKLLAATDISNASPGVVADEDHGLATDNEVTVSGLTGNWAAANGVHKITVVDADSYSIPVDTSTFGALTGDLKVTTRAPQTSRPEWSITKNYYSGSDPVGSKWAKGVSSKIHEWDNRASLAYN